MTADDIETAARQIAADIAAGDPYLPQTKAIAGDMARAYKVQLEMVRELLKSGKRTKVGGFKVAINSPVLMDRFGVTEPVGGHVFADEVSASPARLALSSYGSFHYEPEIAAILKAPLPPREMPYTEAEVAAAIARFVPSFEIIDTRGVKIPDVGLPDAVAQNITNAGAVLGGPGLLPDELDADAIRTIVRENGATQLDAVGARPQPPLEAATFVANLFSGLGVGLEPGMLILCGAHQPPRPLTAATRLEVEMGPLGSAAIILE